MSITTVKANHCDVCGYEWLKTAKTPKRCANPGCRERNWDRPREKIETLKEHAEDTYRRAYEAENLSIQALPRDQQTRAHGIQHTQTCKCLACKPRT